MTTNTDEESRDAFEQYISAQTGYPMEFIKGQRAVKGNGYYNEFLDIPWRTWSASREALKAANDMIEQEGYQAYCNGLYLVNCPYSPTLHDFTSAEASAWKCGYLKAEEAGAPLVSVEEQRKAFKALRKKV